MMKIYLKLKIKNKYIKNDGKYFLKICKDIYKGSQYI